MDSVDNIPQDNWTFIFTSFLGRRCSVATPKWRHLRSGQYFNGFMIEFSANTLRDLQPLIGLCFSFFLGCAQNDWLHLLSVNFYSWTDKTLLTLFIGGSYERLKSCQEGSRRIGNKIISSLDQKLISLSYDGYEAKNLEQTDPLRYCATPLLKIALSNLAR